MNKISKLLLGSFLFLLVAVGFAITASEISLDSPTDNFFNNSDNDTQEFVITLDMAANASADCTLHVNGTDNRRGTTEVLNNTETILKSNESISDGTYLWTVNCVNTTLAAEPTNRTITIDTVDPAIDSESVTDTTFSQHHLIDANFTATDATSLVSNSTCTVNIYEKGTNKVSVSGEVFNETGHVTSCKYQLNSTDVSQVGPFKIEVVIQDRSGNEVAVNTSTNQTHQRIYADLWNHLQASKNTTLGALGNLSVNITHVSLWHNNNKSYSSYVVGASAHEDTPAAYGDAVYVFTTVDGTLLRKWSADVVNINVTVTRGWNQATHVNSSGMTFKNLCDEADTALDNQSMDINFVSLYLANESRYISHKCGFTFNQDQIVERGQAYWAQTNGTANYFRDREELA